MPTITINRKVVESLVGKKLPEKELKDRISMLGTDLEQVDDKEIVVEIFPNRPDMLSEQGFARAFSSFIGSKTGLRKYNVKKSGEKVIVDKSLKNVRPYSVCAILKNLKLDDEKIREIIQIQEKLHVTFCRKRKKAAIGIYPIEEIKFPIYFTAKKPEEIVFRPLEWKKEINAKEILEQHPAGIAYKDLLVGLKKYSIFHDANNDILSMPPVINSHKTGRVSDKTKEVFIEVSGYELHTLNYVLNILVTALADMGAQIYSMDVVYPDKKLTTPNLEPTKMKFDLKYINKLLGLNLSEKQVKELLEKMGFSYEKNTVIIPAYRADILHPVDLAEDIAIAFGYENFTPEIPSKATVGQEDSYEKFRKHVANILTGLNLFEISSYHLANQDKQFKDMSFKSDEFVKLANSLSEEFQIMRYWIMPNLMKVLSENTHNEYPQNLFESGKTFKLGKSDTGVVEDDKLACLLCDNNIDYTKIRQVLDYLFSQIGLKYEIKEAQHPSFISGRSGKIIFNKKELGFIGELHPKVISMFGVEMPIAGFELDLRKVFEKVEK